MAVWLIGGHATFFSNPLLLGLATIAVVLIQHAVNLFNDAKDWQLGADVEKFDSWVRVHGDNPRAATLHGALSLAAGAALGLSVLVVGERLWVLVFALPLALLGLIYNAGKRPLSYTAWGEWATGLCYGGVFAGLWFVAGLPAKVGPIAAGMVAFGGLASALLLSHQPPQVDTDRAAGKQSFAVRHGVEATRRWAKRLHVLALIAMVIAMATYHAPPLLTLSFTIFSLLAIMSVGCPGVNPKRIMVSTSTLFAVVSAINLLL